DATVQTRKRYTVEVEERTDSRFWQARLYLEGEGGRDRRWSTRVPIGTDKRVSKREATRVAEERAEQIAREVFREVAEASATSIDSVGERLLAAKTLSRRP